MRKAVGAMSGGRNFFLFAIALMLAATGCDDNPKPYDERSYDAGFHDGWADTCNRIDRYKESIGKTLKDAHIC